MKISKCLMVLVLVACVGCATKEMKSTPFYTGSDITYTGAVEDRVNLWPLAYYREPVASIAWPLLSYSDDQFAIRPLYSQYRQDGKAGRYDEYNVVWPLAQADLKHDDYRVFPFFWGDDYFTVFPELWWMKKSFVLLPFGMKKDLSFMTVFPIFFGDFAGNQRFNTLLPLYYWDHTEWPAGTDEPKVQESFWALAGLAGYERIDDHILSHRFLPFYAKTQSSFYSLPYSRVGYTGYQSDSGRRYGGTSLWFLGLAGSSPDSSWCWPLYYHDNDELITPLFGKTPNCDWVFPVYYRGPNTFFTPLGGYKDEVRWMLPAFWADKDNFYSLFYCQHKDDTGKVAAAWAPPLLSFYGCDEAKGEVWRVLLGLGGANYPTDGSAETWLMPFYYYASGGTFITPLFGKTTHADWLLPVYYRDDDLFCAFGFYGARGDASWLVPLYYWDDTRFLTPLFGKTPASDWLLPLYYRSGDSFYTLLGGGTPDSHWILPLYYKDGDGLVSLAYCRKQFASGRTEHILPWCLSTATTDADGTFTDFQALVALAGWSASEKGHEQSWILPFYSWEKDRSFISLPYSCWGGGTNQTNTWWATPLVGTRAGRKNGYWVTPLWIDMKDADYDTYASILKGDTLPNWLQFGDETVTNIVRRQKKVVKRPRMIALNAEHTRLFCLFSQYQQKVKSWRDGNASPHFDMDVASHTGNPILFERETHERVRFDVRTRQRVGTRQSDELNGLVNLLFSWETREDKLSPDPAKQSTSWEMRLLALLYNGSSRVYGNGKNSGSANVLGLLYNGEWSEKKSTHSILWRVWHREEEDGNVSIDMFPGFTYDARTDGYRKTSFLWRLWRDEIDPKKGESIDFFFIPVKRP